MIQRNHHDGRVCPSSFTTRSAQGLAHVVTYRGSGTSSLKNTSRVTKGVAS